MLNNNQTMQDLLTLAEKSTYNTIVKLNAKNPTDKIQEVLRSFSDHRTASRLPEITAEILTTRAKHACTLDALEEARKHRDKLTTPEAQRDAWGQMALNLKKEADAQTATIKALEETTNSRYNDFSDLVQVWLLAYMTAEPAPEDINKILETLEPEEEEPAEATAEHIAKIRIAKRAVNVYIRQQASISGLDTYHTNRRPATAEQMNAWKQAGKVYGEFYPIGRTESTETIEYNEKKNRWERVTRYKTVKEGYSLEAMDEAGNLDGYTRTPNSYTDSIGALEHLETLLTVANLTDKQQEFIKSFCSVNARMKGQHARTAYYTRYYATMATEHRAKFLQGLSKAEYTARADHAFSYIGVYAKDRKSKFLTALKKALAPFKDAQPEQTTTTDLDPDKHMERIARAMQANHGTRYTDADPRKDLLNWTACQNQSQSNNTIVTWLTHEEATARATAQLDAIREQHQKSTIEAPDTATARATADSVRKLYNSTPDATTKARRRHADNERRKATARAKAEAEQAQRAREKAEAEELKRTGKMLAILYKPAPVQEHTTAIAWTARPAKSAIISALVFIG